MFNFMKSLGQVRNNFSPDIIKVKSEGQKNAVLEYVYGTDPKTGLPKNDLGMLQNANTPEDVKRFIDSQLIGTVDNRSFGETFEMTDEHSDELLDAMPYRGETLNQYESRVNKMAQDAKDDSMRKKMEFYQKKVRENFEKIAKGNF